MYIINYSLICPLYTCYQVMGPEEPSQTCKDRVDGLEASSSANDTNRNRYFLNLEATSDPPTAPSPAIIDKKENDTPRLMKFNGRKDEDYNLWRNRVELAFKGKKYWKFIQEDNCSEEMKDEA